MATRSIVTSHPEVACDVCGRRLLRGEQPDVFLSGGQRRTVCELCVPRATHEGWLREADDHSLTLRSPGPRRGRSLLGRLRQTRWPVAERSAEDTTLPIPASPPIAATGREEELYDFLDTPLSQARPVAAAPRASLIEAVPTSGDRSKIGQQMERALEVFNGGEHPRRLAGVARSLGAPSARVAPRADSGSVVGIVVAWELCWYRYEVDLGEESAGARLTAQGMELDELPAEDRVANAAIDERGALSLPA
ncbi:MAG: hypothetical protein ACHQDY_06375 [Solirubrobacterales bacterium]